MTTTAVTVVVVLAAIMIVKTWEKKFEGGDMPDKGEKGQLFDEDILGEEGKKIKKTKRLINGFAERKKEQI